MATDKYVFLHAKMEIKLELTTIRDKIDYFVFKKTMSDIYQHKLSYIQSFT